MHGEGQRRSINFVAHFSASIEMSLLKEMNISSVWCGLFAIHKATGLRWGVSSRKQTEVC